MTDYLEPDSFTIPGQKYALINVVSPSSSQKHDTCAVKIKGVFDNIDDAKNHAKKLQKLDPTFDVFLVEMYKWLPIPPTMKDIQDQVFQDEKLNEIITEHANEQIRTKEFFEERKQQLKTGSIDPIDTEEYIENKETYETSNKEAYETSDKEEQNENIKEKVEQNA